MVTPTKMMISVLHRDGALGHLEPHLSRSRAGKFNPARHKPPSIIIIIVMIFIFTILVIMITIILMTVQCLILSEILHLVRLEE